MLCKQGLSIHLETTCYTQFPFYSCCRNEQIFGTQTFFLVLDMEAIEHATHTAALRHTINTFIYITKHLFKDWYKMSGTDRKF